MGCGLINRGITGSCGCGLINLDGGTPGLMLRDGTSLAITLPGILGTGGISDAATWLPPHPPRASSPCVAKDPLSHPPSPFSRSSICSLYASSRCFSTMALYASRSRRPARRCRTHVKIKAESRMAAAPPPAQ